MRITVITWTMYTLQGFWDRHELVDCRDFTTYEHYSNARQDRNLLVTRYYSHDYFSKNDILNIFVYHTHYYNVQL